jgi:hypothetical protein
MAELPGLVDEDLDLDYGGLGVDPNADTKLLEAQRYRRTERVPNAGASWDMAGYLAELKRDAVPFDAGGRRTVIETHYDGAPTLPSKPAQLVKQLAGTAWTVRLQETRVHVGDLLYVGNTDDHSKGDLRTPEHEEVYWAVQGMLRAGDARVAAFWATWTRNEGATKPGNKFESAVTWDAALGTQPTDRAGDFASWLEILGA